MNVAKSLDKLSSSERSSIGVLTHLLYTLLEELFGLLGVVIRHRRPFGLAEGLVAWAGYPVRDKAGCGLGAVVEDLVVQSGPVEPIWMARRTFSFLRSAPPDC